MTDISVALERNQNVCSHEAAFGNSEVIYPMSKKTISASNEQETVTGRHENRTEALPVSMCLNGVSSTVVLLPHNQEPNGKVTQHSVGLSLCKAPRDLQSSAAKLALFFFFFCFIQVRLALPVHLCVFVEQNTLLMQIYV